MILPAESWSMEVVEKNIKCVHRKIIESFNALICYIKVTSDNEFPDTYTTSGYYDNFMNVLLTAELEGLTSLL